MKKISTFGIVFLIITFQVICYSQSQTIVNDIPYSSGDVSDYEKERCKLDVYIPENADGFATIVWFHGGAIKNGDKDFEEYAPRYTREGIAIVSANYRLSPKVIFPEYIKDAAAAVAWTVNHIAEYGGNPDKVFISGHSAGGYLAAMLGMDSEYLLNAGISPDQIAGYIPVSGQMITHSTVREERGVSKKMPVIDTAAPLHFVSSQTKPFLNIAGDVDLPGRAEENMLFAAMMKEAGNTSTQCIVMKDRDHGTLVSRMMEEGDPVSKAIVDFIRQYD